MADRLRRFRFPLIAVALFGGIWLVGNIADGFNQPGRYATAFECVDQTAESITNICEAPVTFKTCIGKADHAKGICLDTAELAPGERQSLPVADADERRATFVCRAPYVPRRYEKQHKPSETEWGCGEKPI